MWPWSTIRRLKGQLAEMSARWTRTNEAYEDLLVQSREQASDIRALTAKLVEAAKNDTRDPVTGRYIKVR